MSKLLNDASIATITVLDNTDYLNPVIAATREIQKITIANFKTGLGLPAIYAGIIDQGGTSAPTINEAINTTGATFTTARTGAGTYTLTASISLFGVGKTVCLFNNSTIAGVGASRASSTVIDIVTSADDILTLCSFKIEIYP